MDAWPKHIDNLPEESACEPMDPVMTDLTLTVNEVPIVLEAVDTSKAT